MALEDLVSDTSLHHWELKLSNPRKSVISNTQTSCSAPEKPLETVLCLAPFSRSGHRGVRSEHLPERADSRAGVGSLPGPALSCAAQQNCPHRWSRSVAALSRAADTGPVQLSSTRSVAVVTVNCIPNCREFQLIYIEMTIHGWQLHGGHCGPRLQT